MVPGQTSSPKPSYRLDAHTTGTATKRQTRRRDFQYKYGQRHHAYDYEKAPYPLSYDRHVLELESLDNRLASYLRGSVSFMDFEEHPTRVLDLGCGTGTWIIDAAKEWPGCHFVGFDLVDVQIPLKILEPSVSRRIEWLHGNFLTTKLPFEDDEFDHVHVQSIAAGIPENKWGTLLDEIGRVLRPGGSVEIIEDDIIFPTLPRWFTKALRAPPVRKQSARYPDDNREDRPPASSASKDLHDQLLHDHALLESLFQSLFEHRFINTKPSSILPSYFTTYFRQVTHGPALSFPMPPLAPLQPLPPQIATSYIIEPISDFPDFHSASSSTFSRPLSLSFSSSISTVASSLATEQNSSYNSRPRTASAPLSYHPDSSFSSFEFWPENPHISHATAPSTTFMLDNSLTETERASQPSRLFFKVERLRSLTERSLAMHLYRNYQVVLACQEAMWEELKDRIRNRRDELLPFGWDDDEELEELQSRKKFERLLERYRSDMQTRISLWSSLDDLGWTLPVREPLSKAELIEEKRMRETMIEARKQATQEELDVPCRTLPTGMAASTSNHDTYEARIPKATVKPNPNKGKGKENRFESASTPSTVGDLLTDSTPWNWTSLTDPSSSRIPPIFTRDGSYFFSLVGSSVKIHSTTTGLVVSTLTAPPSTDSDAHGDTLTSAAINPHNAFQLITASLDGRILVWDYVNATLLQTINVGQPIHRMCVHERFKDCVFIAASKPGKRANVNDNNAVILKVALKQTDSSNNSAEVMPIGKTRFPTGLGISFNGAWLVVAAGHKVYVAKTTSLSSGFTKYVSPERLTCMAFHPSEEYFATGDEKGIIRLWYCLNDDLAINIRGVEKRTQTRSFHWHAHAVSSVHFTPNGAYLLSGGEESVLVVWQLHTGKKEFVPRLGAPISTLSISRSGRGEEEYLVGLADATYTFISSSSLKMTRTYSRIKIAISQGATSSQKHVPPIAFQRSNSTLILPSSHPSSLQIYSLSSSSVISELEVSPSNRVSRRDDKPIIPAVVEKVVVSDSGKWMATIDAREGYSTIRSEVYLKIWSWDTRQEHWVLNTRIDRPHGTDKVIDVSFSPSVTGSRITYLSTTGEDGYIKLWKVAHASQGETMWVSHAALTLRAESPGSICWAPDASLFAASVGSHVAMYNPTSRALCRTLTIPRSCNIQSIHFIGPAGRYLLGADSNSLTVWDLVGNCILWQTTSAHRILKIVSHRKEATFAVFYSSNTTTDGIDCRTDIAIFRATSSVPISLHHIPFGLQNVISTSFHKQTGYSLVAITSGSRVIMLGDSTSAFGDDSPAARGMNFDVQVPKRTLFHDIFGQAAFFAPSNEPVHVPSPPKGLGNRHDLFNDPVYLAPTFDVLFDTAANDFLVSQPSELVIPEGTSGELVEEDLEVDHPRHIFEGHAPRVPIPGEMDLFIKLFKAHCLEDPRPLASTKTRFKPNGIHATEINGSGRHKTGVPVTRTATPHSSRSDLAYPVMDELHLPISLVNGKKRKATN